MDQLTNRLLFVMTARNLRVVSVYYNTFDKVTFSVNLMN